MVAKHPRIVLALMKEVAKIVGIMPLVSVWSKAGGKQVVNMKTSTSINPFIYCKNARGRCLEANSLKTSLFLFIWEIERAG